MDNLIIECVWYRSKRDFNKFVRSIDNDYVSVIDYSIIKNKLVKSDPYNSEPSDAIIGLNIITSIKNALNPEKKRVDLIVYSFKDLTCETVINFKDLVLEHAMHEITFVLNVLNMDQVPNKSILNKFDCVKFVDND